MNTLLLLGLILCVGYAMGRIAKLFRLPEISGYLIAGLLLNPEILPIVPKTFVAHSTPLLDLCLAFIAFEVGTSLSFNLLKKMGKTVLLGGLAASGGAFMAVALSFSFLSPAWGIESLAFAVLLGTLATPTDPSATLAVVHENKAKGPVTTLLLGVAAFDDALTLLAFALGLNLAMSLEASGTSPELLPHLLDTAVELGGAVLLGGLFTLASNAFTRLRPEAEESEFIILIFGFLALCVGTSLYFSLDSLMACLVFGLGIANFNSQKEKITSLLERYTERLIFLLFFVLSGMTLSPSVLLTLWPLTLAFVFFRAMGKIGGIFLVTSLLRAPKAQRYYTGIGLLPQGGIVIGLALLVQKEAAFSDFSTTLSGIVMGATLIHELLAPWLAQKSLAAAGELHGKAKS